MKRNGFIVFLIVLVIMAVFNHIFFAMEMDMEREHRRLYFLTPVEWLILFSNVFSLSMSFILSLIPSMIVALLWCVFKKLHPLTFVVSYIVLVTTSCVFFFSNFGFVGIQFFALIVLYIFTASMANFPVCWLSKQFCDEKGREFSLNICENSNNRKNLISIVVYFFIFSVTSFLIFYFYIIGFYSPSIKISDNTRIATILITQKLYFIVPIIAYFYLVAELLRKGKITMVKFTRIGILVHIAYVLLIFLIMNFVYHQYDEAIELYQETGKIKGYVVFQAMRLFFYVVCFTSISFSLSFWLTGKILQLTNRLAIRKEKTAL